MFGFWGWRRLPEAIGGKDPASRALRSHIEAAKRGDCDAVWNGFSRRTRQLLMDLHAGRAGARTAPGSAAPSVGGVGGAPDASVVVRQTCQYSGDSPDLKDLLVDTIRLIEGAPTAAVVGVRYEYDRFFGFFGKGRATARFPMVFELGAWEVDHTEELDPDSRTNQNERALYILHQVWLAERNALRETSRFTADPAAIQAQIPGFPFPPIRPGIARPDSAPETIHLSVLRERLCISTRSAAGPVVMISMTSDHQDTWDFGRAVSACMQLERRYPGISARIR